MRAFFNGPPPKVAATSRRASVEYTALPAPIRLHATLPQFKKLAAMTAMHAPGEGPYVEPARPFDRGRRALAALTSATAIGLSICILYRTVQMPAEARLSFLTENFAADSRPLRLYLLSLAPALFGAVLLRWKPERGLEVLERIVKIACPLILAGGLAALFSWRLAQQRPVAYLILLSGYGLALERLLRVSLGELSRALISPVNAGPTPVLNFAGSSRYVGASVVTVAAVAYAAYTAFYTIRHHQLFGTTAFDLGIYDNMIFNALKGRFFRAPVLYGPGNFNSLSGHAEYIVPLFAPIYALKPGPEMLLCIQATCFGGAAIPLYFFAQALIGRFYSVLIALSYLLFAPLHGPQFYDFHWLPLCIPFYFLLFYAIAARKNWLTYALIPVLFAIREDVAIGLACLGIFLFATGQRARFGAALAIVSSVWFAINKFAIMPWAGSWWFENIYSELFADGKASYANVIKTLITNPFFTLSTLIRGPKLTYTLHMLAPLIFLPVRRAAFWLLFLPGALLTLMTTGYWPTISIAFQYTSDWIPFLFGATVVSLHLLGRGRHGRLRVASAMGALCVVMLSHSYGFGAVLQHESFTGGFGRIDFEMSDAARRRYADMRQLVDKIPPDASVAATEYMSPHLSTRLTSYVFRYDVGPVDYIFISDNEMVPDLRRALGAKFSRESYGLFAKGEKEFFLFKRGYQSSETAAAYRHLGIQADPVVGP